MVEVVTDFTEFVKNIQAKNKYTIHIKINDMDMDLCYSEPTSQEDIRNSKEFEMWYQSKYKDEQRALKLALDGQWRIWKMIQRHMKGMDIFENFLELPTPVAAAIVRAIEEDLVARYPHLNKK